MEKQVRRFEVDYHLKWQCGVEIKKLREDLDAIEKMGATHVVIEPHTEYDCSYVSIDAFAERMETDKEFQARVDEVNSRREEHKRRELEQLQMLKSKYGM